MASPAGQVEIRAWKPPIPGLREVLHARFVDHAYPRHTHDAWTLFVVDDGVVRYDLERRPGGATRPVVTVLPPHVVHDGRPGSSAGYRKRVLYVETDLIPERLIGPAVDRPVIVDRQLRRDVAALHDRLGCADDGLEAETRLHFAVERIRAVLGEAPPPDVVRPAEVAEQLRALLDAHLAESWSLARAAAEIGVGPTGLARAFSRAFGISPHRYVTGRRIDAARDRILRGQPLADVAAEVGFVDQAHLTRRFREFLGTTPGRFATDGRDRIGHST